MFYTQHILISNEDGQRITIFSNRDVVDYADMYDLLHPDLNNYLHTFHYYAYIPNNLCNCICHIGNLSF